MQHKVSELRLLIQLKYLGCCDVLGRFCCLIILRSPVNIWWNDRGWMDNWNYYNL